MWTIDTIPAYCITLERRSDRWKKFQDKSGINGLDLQRFIGVDGKTLDIKTDDRLTLGVKRNILKKFRRGHEEIDSAGAIGCALSHIALWQHMVDKGIQLMVIFEDDANVPDDFVSRANNCIKNSPILQNPDSWDLWLLGGIMGNLTEIPGDKVTVRSSGFLLLHAYVITLPTAKRLLSKVYPIERHIDYWISMYGQLYDLRIVTCPSLNIKQNIKIKSDISTVEKECDICNVPVDFKDTHQLVPNFQYRLGQLAEIVLVGLAGYWIYKRIYKDNS